MALARVLVALLLVGGLGFFAAYVLTGQRRYRVIGIRLIQGTVIAGMVFFGSLILERLAELF